MHLYNSMAFMVAVSLAGFLIAFIVVRRAQGKRKLEALKAYADQINEAASKAALDIAVAGLDKAFSEGEIKLAGFYIEAVAVIKNRIEYRDDLGNNEIIKTTKHSLSVALLSAVQRQQPLDLAAFMINFSGSSQDIEDGRAHVEAMKNIYFGTN